MTIDLHWGWHGAGIESIETCFIPTNTSTMPIDSTTRYHGRMICMAPMKKKPQNGRYTPFQCPSTIDGFQDVYMLQIRHFILQPIANVPPTVPTYPNLWCCQVAMANMAPASITTPAPPAAPNSSSAGLTSDTNGMRGRKGHWRSNS